MGMPRAGISGGDGLLGRILRDCRGGIAVSMAVSILLMFGAVGLGAEGASWYSIRRDMQNAADLGAESAIVSLKTNAGGTAATITTYAYNEAKSAAAIHGLADGSNGVTITPLTPPGSGSYTSSSYLNKAIEVTISKPVNAMFSGLFLSTGPTIAVRAVAAIVPGSGDCVLATSPTASQAIAVIGNTTVNVGCGIADNSNASDALYFQGSATLTTSSSVTVNGNYSATGKAYTFSYGSADINKGTTVADPYTGSMLPSLYSSCSNCTYVNKASLSSLSGTSGTFTGGGVFTGPLAVSGTLSLSNGIYYIDGGNLTVKNATLTTSNATIVLTSSTSNSNIGTLQVDANGVLNLTAPTSSTYKTQGIAIMQDPSVASGTDNHMQSNPTVTVAGAMYFPSGRWSMQGTPTWNATTCTQLIANTFTLQGNPNLSDTNCSGAGAKEFGPGSVELVE
jgi:Putative Flp pilus-assembly TadE/G-like